MNTSRLLITLVAALGLAISSGCGSTQTDGGDSPSNTAVETDMNIVIPDATAEPAN